MCLIYEVQGFVLRSLFGFYDEIAKMLHVNVLIKTTLRQHHFYRVFFMAWTLSVCQYLRSQEDLHCTINSQR